MNETKFEKKKMLGVLSRDLYWENKTYKLKRSITSVYEKGSLIFEVAACRHFKPCLWRLRIRAQYCFRILQSRKDI